MTDSDTSSPGPIRWWQRPATLVGIVLLGLLPLLWPTMPPLTDLPGHAARWHIATTGPASPLAGYYEIRWSWIGNLGTDLLALPLVPLLGAITTAKLIAILVAAVNLSGILLLSRTVHGRVTPVALFALPFVYAWPFQMGFVNFVLAQGLSLWALALWLHLGRTGRTGLRAAIFAVVGVVLWTVHSAGWGLFGLMAFGSELARLRGADRDGGRSWLRAATGAFIACLPLALPVLIMIANRPEGARASETGDWFNMLAKFLWLLSSLRDRWQWFDLVSLGLLILLLYVAARDKRLGYDSRLEWPALFCLGAFLILPRLLMGGSYVDMRVVPALWILTLLAIRPPRDAKFAATLALAGAAFFGVRLAGTTASFTLRAIEQRNELTPVALIPRGAPVLALAYKPCLTPWSDIRPDHLPAYTIIARDAFVNEQWAIGGQQYLKIRYRPAMPFAADPTQLAYPENCEEQGASLAHGLATFPRDGFRYVWVIGNRIPEPRDFGLETVWLNERSGLYEVIGTMPSRRVQRRP